MSIFPSELLIRSSYERVANMNSLLPMEVPSLRSTSFRIFEICSSVTLILYLLNAFSSSTSDKAEVWFSSKNLKTFRRSSYSYFNLLLSLLIASIPKISSSSASCLNLLLDLNFKRLLQALFAKIFNLT